MKKLSNKEIGKLKTNPIFDGMSDELKDTARYAEIEKKMRVISTSDHTHATVKGYVKCKRCVPKLKARREALIGFGFAGYEQYVEWRKVMNVILTQQDLTFNETN